MVTIGTFDGVHVGHRKIISRLVNVAKKEGISSTILTFFPHPRMVLQKDMGVRLINTIQERKDILEKTGIDHLVVHPFTKAFSRLTARDYVESILVNQLHAKKIIIGYDHRFGRNRTADIETLRDFGREFDFEVEEISQQDIDDVAVSSTKIRKALSEGDLDKANTYLGRPFILSGKVIRGKQIGKKLSFPTANLYIEENYKLIPKNGVYVVRSKIDGQQVYGMMNIGTNPTVAESDMQNIETHFFDFEKDIYNQDLRIEVLTRIRDERKFDSLEELQDAMRKDQQFSQRFIETYKN